MSESGHKRKSSVGLGMSEVGGRADEIRGKADIGTHAAWLAELDKSAITH